MKSETAQRVRRAFDALPDGTYEVTVQLAPGDTAIFRDVTVSASTMMMGH